MAQAKEAAQAKAEALTLDAALAKIRQKLGVWDDKSVQLTALETLARARNRLALPSKTGLARTRGRSWIIHTRM